LKGCNIIKLVQEFLDRGVQEMEIFGDNHRLGAEVHHLCVCV